MPRWGEVSKGRIEDMLLDMGFANVRVRPATGYWNQHQQDVHAWEANGDKDGMTYDISSWSTMRECLRHGFTLYRPERSSAWELETQPNKAK